MLEMGRSTTAYVSGYNRARVHQCTLMGGEVRLLGANFNGCMPVGETIASVTWDTWNTATTVLGTGAIGADGRTVSVDMKAQCTGRGTVRCTVTTTGGGKYVQYYSICVAGQAYAGDVWLNGASSVTVVAV